MLALSIKNLVKNYKSFEALKGISLEVEEGDFFALLGPNGAGKSTTIGIISSLINKTSGEVKIFGHNIDNDLVNAKQHLGLVPQEFNFNIFETPWDIIVNQAGFYGIPRKLAKERAEYFLRKLDLWEKKDTVSKFLSGGMKRRLMIARGLVHHPKLLILDEPTAGVDIEIRRSMWEFLRELNKNGTTIILTTHYLEEAEQLCRNIAIMLKGKVIENTSIRSLLGTLKSQSVVLETKRPLLNLPEIEGFTFEKEDEHNLEVRFCSQTNLNKLFLELNKLEIEVIGVRNKSNRLEEMFVDLTSA